MRAVCKQGCNAAACRGAGKQERVQLLDARRLHSEQLWASVLRRRTAAHCRLPALLLLLLPAAPHLAQRVLIEHGVSLRHPVRHRRRHWAPLAGVELLMLLLTAGVRPPAASAVQEPA